MELQQLISKAYCINLYYRKDRWKTAAMQFAKHGLNVERFNAIDGMEFTKSYPARPGNCGCNLSHFLIIQAAYIMGLPAILIFEDDVVLHADFVRLMNECIRQLPYEWDMLMLGGSHREAPEPFRPNLLRVKKAFCTHGYIIRESMYAELLQRMLPFDKPQDELLTEFQKTHRIFITDPPLAWQDPGFSDIEGRIMNYSHIKSNRQ
jgi:GR25 family glycosyltransferase involved in LPS biosynthesis